MNKKNPLRLVVIAFGLVVVVCVGFFVRAFASQGGGKGGGGGGGGGGSMAAGSSSAERVVAVTTATVARRDVPVVLEGLGTALPLASVVVKSQVDGRLDKVLFTEGKEVKKGEVLALVDSRPFMIQLHQGEAALERDEATLKNGQLNLDRYETLRKQNLIPQQQVDDQKVVVSQAEAAARTDKAQIENARLYLDYSRITSPIDGVTGIRQVDPGNLVHASDTNGIVIVTQIDPISVVFTLPEDDLSRVQTAMKAGPVTVDAYARDGVQKLGTGSLLLIDNQVNMQTATIRLKSAMPNPDKALWPNAFVKARMNLMTMKNVLVVPAEAVQRGPNGTFVYVMAAADKSVSPRPVEVTSIEGAVAVIAKGLNENEIVVTDGQNQLRPGGKISPRSPASARPSAASSSPAPREQAR